MTTKTMNFLLLGLIAITTLAGVILYPSLPDQIASHWNAAGTVNGYMSKGWGVFLLPLIMAGLFALRLITLKIDPLKKNVESFRKYYDILWVTLFAFLIYIFGLMMAWNLGYRFNFTVTIIPAMAVLLYVIGSVLDKSKRNWFLGIRTPWTLSSDVVWEKTHKLGAKLFKVAAVMSLIGLFSQNQSFIIAALILPILAVSVVTIAYSYLVYRKLPK